MLGKPYTTSVDDGITINLTIRNSKDLNLASGTSFKSFFNNSSRRAFERHFYSIHCYLIQLILYGDKKSGDKYLKQ